MATSGSINYSTSASEIITEALELLGVLGEGEAYTPAQYTSTVRTLNMMIKNWQAAGLNLFAVQTSFLFLEKGRSVYRLDATTPQHFSSQIFTTFAATTAAAAATSIDVTAINSIVIGSKIGIQLSSGTDVHWTTVNSIAGVTVGFVDPLPSTVNTDAIVYYYFTTANRPMRVLSGYMRRNQQPSNPIDIPMGMLSRTDYWALSTKSTKAMPLQMYFDPQRTYSELSIWPTPDNQIDYIVLICQRTLEDFDLAADEPDYPQEWFLPLAYGLAVLLAPKYGTPVQDYARIQQTAAKLYEDAFGWDAEQGTSVYFKPDNWGMDIGRRGN